jgi:hypothetical protein
MITIPIAFYSVKYKFFFRCISCVNGKIMSVRVAKLDRIVCSELDITSVSLCLGVCTFKWRADTVRVRCENISKCVLC